MGVKKQKIGDIRWIVAGERELKLQYKEMKPPMGIFIIHALAEKKCFFEATQNLKARINSTTAKLKGGFHPYLELQKAWKDHGEENFIIEILENLEYNKDESKTDYKEELALLQIFGMTNWLRRILSLIKRGCKFITKK